jgi:hypothetical protein
MALLNICEGWIYLVSMYYKRYELQRRINVIFCGAVLAGAVSGVSNFSSHAR